MAVWKFAARIAASSYSMVCLNLTRAGSRTSSKPGGEKTQKPNQELLMKVFLLLSEKPMCVSELAACIQVDHRQVERVIRRLRKPLYIDVQRTEISPKNRKPVHYYRHSPIGASLYDYSIWEKGLRSLPFPDAIPANAQFNLNLTASIDNTTTRRKRMLPLIVRAMKGDK
jgi:hypothetical protein